MEDKNREYEELLRELLESRQYTKLRQTCADMQTADIAAVMDDMEDEESLKIFRILPKSMAADVFADLEFEDQQYIIQSLSDKEASSVIDNLMADDAADFLEEMPANVVKRILSNARPDTRADINHLLRYPEDSAGSIMTVEYVDLKESMTVRDAIERIRKIGLDTETVNVCYVLDPQRVLLGTVALRYLVMADPDTIIGEMMNENIISIGTMTDQEEAAMAFQKYDFTAMPVVDNENRMVGIITIDDIVDIIQEEATEDIEKMAAILPTDRPYFKTGILETYKARMPWLLFLMISATFTGAIITRAEGALAKYVILTAYIPMLMDTGGNAGSQASVSIIRGISLGEIEFKEILSAVWKEVRVAAMCGVTLSLCNFVKLLVIDRIPVQVAAIVCVTLVVVVLIAKVIGCVLPLTADHIGFDPAVMASPFITTIVDAISLTVYFTIAKTVLHIESSQRKTMVDVYGTLGPSCSSREVLADMFRAGMTGIRLNLSHISLRESERQLEIFHAAAQEAGVKPLLLVDMQGPELRIGRLRAPLMLCENETAVLFSENLPEEDRLLLRREGKRAVSVPDAVCRAICPGSEILMDDGRLLVRALETRDGFAEVHIVRGGMISGRKSIKVIGADIHPPTMTNADLQNIRDASSYGVTGIMQPFVRNRSDLETVREALSANNARDLQLVAKIENREGMGQLDSLLPVCDAICIARGDLGNDMPLWELPEAQKMIAASCRAAGRYFMVATQMLSSMEKNAVPTRAELNDIFNTVADGASGVMVTGETAVGKYPVDVVRYLAKTAVRASLYRQS